MLKGHTFNLQTFTSEAFALFIDRFLNKRCGVASGCELSNTNNSVTIGDGYFVVRGRFLQVISGVTISDITTNGFYRLVCEIDLSKTNTVDTLNQAEIKTIYNSSTYPTLTQQDITESGTVYQYEFASFKVEGGNITAFEDRRTFVDYETIVLKNDFKKFGGQAPLLESSSWFETFLPDGFNIYNCSIISYTINGYHYNSNYTIEFVPENKIRVSRKSYDNTDTVYYNLTLMKIT